MRHMELREAIEKRHSVRGYLKKPIPREVIEDVLNLATRAVSAHNTQPWEISVVTGEKLRLLVEANLKDLFEQCTPTCMGHPAHGVYKERGSKLGAAIFSVMGIAREDKKKRGWWSSLGFGFFGAPAAIILSMDKSLDETWFRFDMGCLTQNICIAAMEHGLSTCVEDQAVIYERGIREVLGLSEEKRPVIGIAIGYEDESFPANSVRAPREPLEKIVTWFEWP